MRWRPGYAGAAESGAGPPGRLAGRADRPRLLGRAKARERSPTTPLARAPGVHRTLGAPHSRAPACRADGTDRRRPAVLDPMHSAEDKYTASEGLRQHVHISMDRHVRAENSHGADSWRPDQKSIHDRFPAQSDPKPQPRRLTAAAEGAWGKALRGAEASRTGAKLSYSIFGARRGHPGRANHLPAPSRPVSSSRPLDTAALIRHLPALV